MQLGPPESDCQLRLYLPFRAGIEVQEGRIRGREGVESSGRCDCCTDDSVTVKVFQHTKARFPKGYPRVLKEENERVSESGFVVGERAHRGE